MLKIIDNFLNKITMYRLVLYYLIVILVAAFVLTLFNLLPYGPILLLFSILFILVISYITNFIFVWAFKAPANTESVYITALILGCVIRPAPSFTDLNFITLAFWASILAVVTKYLLVIKKKHIFNPVAIALVLTLFFFDLSASWWVGTLYLTPVVLLGGLLLTRKLIRSDLVISFMLPALLVMLIPFLDNLENITKVLNTILLKTSFLFFAFVMLTEPLTTPATRFYRMLYGAFVGLIFSPTLHIGSIYSTPELALVIGNIFSYIIGPKQKLILILKDKINYGKDIVHFIFSSNQKLRFVPGQYLEWTLAESKADNRGNRRYFTLASSPTEDEIGLGVKFYPDASTFKKDLQNMEIGDKIIASQLAGDFTLPKDKSKKLVFLVGGIGITPFRSMIKNLLDTKERRDIIQFYSNKLSSEVAYKDVFDQAEKELGIKTIYAVTDKTDPQYSGRISDELIKREVTDYLERHFYLSGPRNLVVAFEKTLKSLGVKNSHIKTDFFPGFV